MGEEDKEREKQRYEELDLKAKKLAGYSRGRRERKMSKLKEEMTDSRREG